MNFLTMQSLGSYTKNLALQMKWQKKKDNNDFTANGKTKLTDPIALQAEQIRQSQADGSAKFSSQIRTKLAAGKKLTQEEMDYLEKHDPQTYQKVKALEAEQKNYEKELKNCKTKDDVERVRMNRTAAALSVVKSVESNSAIPESAKLGLVWQELQKNMALEEEIKKFVASGRYAQLPTEAEKLAAEKELKEAQKAELGIEDLDHAHDDQIEGNEAADSEVLTDSAAVSKDGSADRAKETVTHEAAQKSRPISQEKRTYAEAESTPEALKVRRAKAQAAYQGAQVELPEQVMDLKVK